MATNAKSLQRRERERETVREQILRSAMNILVNEGYEAVSIRRIADDVSYTPGAIYSYFADKEEIIFTLALRAADKFNQTFFALQSVGDPRERLIAIGKAYIHFALEHKESYDLMFIMSTPMHKMSQDGFDKGSFVFHFLRSTVAECIQRGYLPEADVDAAAFALWAFVHGSVSLFIRKRMTMISEEACSDVLHEAYAYFTQLIHNYSNENII